MTHKIRIVAIIAVLGLLLSPGNVTGQVPAFVGRQASAGSAFTYQGQLKAGSSPIMAIATWPSGYTINRQAVIRSAQQ